MGFSEILLALNTNIKKPLNQLIEEQINKIYNIINNSSYGNNAIKNAINNVNTSVNNVNANVNRGAVKSIQRGTVDLRHQSSKASIEVDISSVDMSKSIILVNTEEAYAIDTGSYYTNNARFHGVSVNFLTSSKIKIEANSLRYSTTNANWRNIYVSWQVVEFY